MPPAEQGSAFVPAATVALADILCHQEERTVGNDNTVRYQGLILQIPPSPWRPHFVKARVRVHRYINGELAIFHGPRRIARFQADGQPHDEPAQHAA